MTQNTLIDTKNSYEKKPMGDTWNQIGDDTYIRFKKIKQQIDQIPNSNLLIEVGCGKGALARYIMANKNTTYIGIDFSKTALKHSHQQMPKAHFINADANHLPIKQDIADAILCSEVLEHIPNGYKQAIKEIYSLLKPRGKLLLTVPNRHHINIKYNLLRYHTGVGQQEYDNPPEPRQLAKNLNTIGLQVEYYKNFCPHITIASIAGTLTKKIDRAVNAFERNFRTLFNLMPVYPTQLYIFIECTKNND
jgi:ubiquinone/menaquinone biosynthesis C-methylase UbiE